MKTFTFSKQVWSEIEVEAKNQEEADNIIINMETEKWNTDWKETRIRNEKDTEIYQDHNY